MISSEQSYGMGIHGVRASWDTIFIQHAWQSSGSKSLEVVLGHKVYPLSIPVWSLNHVLEGILNIILPSNLHQFMFTCILCSWPLSPLSLVACILNPVLPHAEAAWGQCLWITHFSDKLFIFKMSEPVLSISQIYTLDLTKSQIQLLKVLACEGSGGDIYCTQEIVSLNPFLFYRAL